MKKFLSGICAMALAASFAVTSIVPVAAAPIFVPKATTADTTDLIQVRDRSDQAGDGLIWKRRSDNNGNMRRKNWDDNDGNWNGGKNWNGNNYGWYNGHKGSLHHRSGYRRHNGLWFPAGAFIAGALITGAIVNQPRAYGGNAHVEWCYDRWLSYRAYDNSYQPNYGGRRLCDSPYN